MCGCNWQWAGSICPNWLCLFPDPSRSQNKILWKSQMMHLNSVPGEFNLHSGGDQPRHHWFSLVCLKYTTVRYGSTDRLQWCSGQQITRRGMTTIWYLDNVAKAISWLAKRGIFDFVSTNQYVLLETRTHKVVWGHVNDGSQPTHENSITRWGRKSALENELE